MFEKCEDDIIDINELMEILNIGRNTAYKLLNNGEIKAIRIGNRWKIPKYTIENFIREKIK